MRKTGNYKHGGKGTRLYRIWKNIKSRCTNPKVWNWRYYGGRGIMICKSWAGNFVVFRNWAIKNGYKDTLEIDRKDNDSGYRPGNCRWVTKLQNRMNATNFVRSKEITDQIKSLRSQGVPFTKVAIIVGVSKSTVERTMYSPLP